MPARTRADPALVKALARAHRWKQPLESSRCGWLAELALAEKIDRSYLGKTLRLTLLAPDIVEAILDGRQPCALPRLLCWRGCRFFGMSSAASGTEASGRAPSADQARG